MKKWRIILCLLLMCTVWLAACAGKQPSAPEQPDGGTNVEQPENPDDGDEIVKRTFTGTATDSFGGALGGVTVTLNGVSTTTDGQGAFTLSEVEKGDDNAIEFVKTGFVAQTVDVSGYYATNMTAVKVGSVRLMRQYAAVASIEDNDAAFHVLVTRDATSLRLAAVSENDAFTRAEQNSTLEFYVSVGAVGKTRDGNVTRIAIDGKGNTTKRNYGDKDLSAYTVETRIEKAGDGLTVTASVPFSMLGCRASDIVGVAAAVYSYTQDDRAELKTLDGTGTVNMLFADTYIRADKDNSLFTSTVNARPEDVPTPVDREALTRGYRMRFSVPALNNRGDVADDMYLKVDPAADGFDVSMIGFGDFSDSEYVKLIFHTVGTNGTGWNVQASDLNVLVAKNRAQKRTGVTKFWTTDGGYSNFSDQGEATANAPKFAQHDGYFTLTIRVGFDEIPDYAAENEISLFAMEFEDNGSANGSIYDATSYVNGMLIDGASRGDPAAQSSYFVIQSDRAPADLSAVEGYDMRFSMGADDIYAKVERHETAMTVYLRSFNPFGDNDFVRLIVHAGDPIGDNAWALDGADVSFTITKTAAYTQTGKIGFYEGAANKFHDGKATLHAPVYEESEDYWSLTLTVEYIELGDDVDGATELRAFMGEYVSNVLYLGAAQSGVTLDDQAYQKNWFKL